MEVPPECLQAFRSVESGVPGVQPMPRRVVDIEQDGVKLTPQPGIIESPDGIGGQCKEIAFHIAGAGIGRQSCTQGNHPVPVPADYWFEIIDYHHLPNPGMAKYCGRCVTEPQSADHHVNLARCLPNGGKTEIGKRLLHDVEETAHQELAVEDDLMGHFVPQHRNPPPPQDQFPERGDAVVEFLKGLFHQLEGCPVTG